MQGQKSAQVVFIQIQNIAKLRTLLNDLVLGIFFAFGMLFSLDIKNAYQSLVIIVMQN